MTSSLATKSPPASPAGCRKEGVITLGFFDLPNYLGISVRRIGAMTALAAAGFLAEFDPSLHKYEVLKYGVFIAKHPRLIRNLICTYSTVDPEYFSIRREESKLDYHLANRKRPIVLDEWRVFETYDEALTELDRWRNNEGLL